MSNKMNLDPENWEEFRALGHKAWDAMVDHLQEVKSRPVWTEMTPEVRFKFATETSPTAPQSIASVYSEFETSIKPYGTGNIHPGFMGWVHGGGSPVGMLADMLSSGMNMNCGGRDHVGIAMEQQVVAWVKGWFDFPSSAGAVFVTGSSQANFMGLLAARAHVLGADNVKTKGVLSSVSGEESLHQTVVIYASEKAHRCVDQAVEMSGYGSQVLRKIHIDPQTHRMDVIALENALHEDKAMGRIPLMIFATAGTVDTGAIDDLEGIAALGKREGVWVHVDGAFGALGVLSHTVKPLLRGISNVDSIAFDFHKWGQVPYSAGMIVVRNGQTLRQCFSSPANYLSREKSGLMSGEWWPCDFGPDLSRGCSAMKTWWTLKVNGTDNIGRMMTHQCNLAAYLAKRIDESTDLERMAPVALNIVCFRYIHSPNDDTVGIDVRKRAAVQSWLSRHIVMKLHGDGLVAPSLTKINGESVIRAALFNHRIEQIQVENLFDSVIRFGRELEQIGIPAEAYTAA